MFEYKILNMDADSFSVENQFAHAVLEGLSKKNKCLPSWLIFDNQGSEIFKKSLSLQNTYQPLVNLKYLIST